MSLLDLRGASGADLRFRHIASPSELSTHAGNFVVATSDEGGPPQVMACGTRRSLAELARLWPELTGTGGRLFVRLNVRRAIRLAEHDDLVAALRPRDVLLEHD